MLKSIIIPEGVTEIEDYAFAKCKSLSRVTLPKSIGKIGDSAFFGAGIKDIYFNGSAKCVENIKIGHWNFSASMKKNIYVKGIFGYTRYVKNINL